MPIDFQYFTDTSVKVPTKHIISIEDITINKELGMGQFGVVQQGTWMTGNQRVIEYFFYKLLFIIFNFKIY